MSERGMRRAGMVVAVVLAVIGLVVVGYFVLMTIAFNAWASNK